MGYRIMVATSCTGHIRKHASYVVMVAATLTQCKRAVRYSIMLLSSYSSIARLYMEVIRGMKVIKILFTVHLAALVLGLGSLLFISSHPEIWHTSPIGVAIFENVLRSAGTLHVLFGAATMFLFGLLCVGPRKTLVFFIAATMISLSM